MQEFNRIRTLAQPFSRIRDLTKINPTTFYNSKVDEDPQGFIDEVQKVVDVMGVNNCEKADLDAYQLKNRT